jgi:hydroxyacylglutathione hydrolase
MPDMTPVLALYAFRDNYIWVIQHESSFVCIDPGDAKPVLAFAKQSKLSLTSILITHDHADHRGGVPELREHFPNATLYTPSHAGSKLHVGNYCFHVIATPGHTHNHVCYLESNMNWLFCGDTLFSAGCGRVFDGSLHELYTSLQILKQLPDDTQVFCAHEYTRQNLAFALTIEPDNQVARDYLTHLNASPNQISLPSSIKLEKKINPFLRLEAPEVQRFVTQHGVDANIPEDCFACLRHAKDNFN